MKVQLCVPRPIERGGIAYSEQDILGNLDKDNYFKIALS